MGILSCPIIKDVILPILTTLAGVYVASWLENGRVRVEQREKTAAILSVANEECSQIEKQSASLNVTEVPITPPIVAVSLLNLIQQPTNSKGLTAVVSSLGGIQRNASDYQRTAAEYRDIELRQPVQFAPAIFATAGPALCSDARGNERSIRASASRPSQQEASPFTKRQPTTVKPLVDTTLTTFVLAVRRDVAIAFNCVLQGGAASVLNPSAWVVPDPI
jgi:hypothetical protein